MLLTQNRADEVIGLKSDLENLRHVVSQTNSTMIDVITSKQAILEERISKVGSFVGWEYSRTSEWSSRHGTIAFDRKLIDYTDGAYTVRLQSIGSR